MKIPERAHLLRELFERRILVLDGAMGTMIQSKDLTAADFGGASLEGCNEHLNLTRPDAVLDIHDAYLVGGGGPRLEQFLRLCPLCARGI